MAIKWKVKSLGLKKSGISYWLKFWADFGGIDSFLLCWAAGVTFRWRKEQKHWTFAYFMLNVCNAALLFCVLGNWKKGKLGLIGCINVMVFHFWNKEERKNMKFYFWKFVGKTCMHELLLELTPVMEMLRVGLLHFHYSSFI